MNKSATGENYIICYEKYIATLNDFHSSLRRGHYIVFPSTGDVFDFGEATKPVYVGGKQYNTVANGNSSPNDVSGKKIRITGVYSGDETEFATIRYTEVI